MHSIDYLINEVGEKLKLGKIMKQQNEIEKKRSFENLKALTTTIDKTIAYHIETLKIRSNWLKSHAEDILNLKQESLSEKLEELNISIENMSDCLDNVGLREDQDLREMLTNTLNSINLNEMKNETGTLAFSADNDFLKENIISFGNIVLEDSKDSDVMDAGFVIADMKDSESQHTKFYINDDEVSSNVWLRDDIKKSVPVQSEGLQSPLAEKISDWLMCVESKSSIDQSSSTDTESQSSDYSQYLYKKKAVNSSVIEKSPRSAHSITECLDDLASCHFLHSNSSSESYKYPKFSFLDHCDDLQQQKNHHLLIRAEEKSSKLPFEDDKCQWLFKSKNCDTSCTSSAGCQMFDAKWLRTASDW